MSQKLPVLLSPDSLAAEASDSRPRHTALSAAPALRCLQGITLALSVIGIFAVPPVLAELTAAEAIAAVEKSKDLRSEYQHRLRAAVADNQVAISAYRVAHSTDNDCKIDAVLMTRAIMSSSSGKITRVQVRFYDPSDQHKFNEVSISAGDIAAFAKGDIDQKTLLSSLDLETHNDQPAPAPTEHQPFSAQGHHLQDGQLPGKKHAFPDWLHGFHKPGMHNDLQPGIWTPFKPKKKFLHPYPGPVENNLQ